MIKRFLIILSIILFLTTSTYSQNLFSCRVSNGGSNCNSDESSMNFYLNGNFYPLGNPSQVLSSKVSLIYNSSTYNKTICCKINNGLGKVIFNTSILATNACPTDYKDLLYFTNSTNAVLGFPESSGFNVNNYTNKLCVKVPNEFSSLDIVVNESKDWNNRGYTCLFKTDGLSSSVVSSCDATFLTGTSSYKYTLWARLWESTSSLKCNSDCTNNFDNRVYDACGQKILKCKGIPTACNGALLNSMVDFDGYRDVKCVAPWNIYKEKTFTNQNIKINVSEKSKCLNLIRKKYSVILNNELVTMNIYTCN